MASHADISAEGFMRGAYMKDESNALAVLGSSYYLPCIKDVTHDDDTSTISFTYDPSEKGVEVQTITLRAQNLELSKQWHASLVHQAFVAPSIPFVERVAAPSNTSNVAKSLAAVGGSLRNMMAAARNTSLSLSFGSSKGGASGSEANEGQSSTTSADANIATQPVEVAATDTEEKSDQAPDKRKTFAFNRQSLRNLSASLSAKTMNILPSIAPPKELLRPVTFFAPRTAWKESYEVMQSEAFGYKLYDDKGHSLVVLHGWLSKRNKTGLRAGLVEKDRYFVLLPHGLAYFPDEQSANVVEGYLHGVVSGTKISGLFNKTGALLPLVSVCGIRVVRNENELLEASNALVDPDDEDVESEEEVKPTAGAPDNVSSSSVEKESTASPNNEPNSAQLESLSVDSSTNGNCNIESIPEEEEDAGDRVFYLDIDFGEYNLILNAHSRDQSETWRKAIQSWTSWQKKRVDQHLFATMGGY